MEKKHYLCGQNKTAMNHKVFLLLFFLLLVTCVSLPSRAEESSFYSLPKGAFVSGTSLSGGLLPAEIYAPYSPEGKVTYSSTTGAGDWYAGSWVAINSESYTHDVSMKGKYHIPQLKQDGKMNYQYGATGQLYNANLWLKVGDSEMHYMTPAKLRCDLAQGEDGIALSRTTSYGTEKYDAMGLYFNNSDVMYIDGINIPICAYKDNQTMKDMFPTEGAHVVVNIYKATAVGGKTNNAADKTKSLWTGILTKEDCLEHSDKNRGALNKTFATPISINGPFVIELSDMKNSGCDFCVMIAQERENCNYWGYVINKEGKEAYFPSYTLAISVHAMFPVLYPKEGESMDITFPAAGVNKDIGIRPTRTTYANCQYASDSGWVITKPDYVSLTCIKDEDFTTWNFSAEANNTATVRQGQVVLNFRGKTLTYNITQEPMWKVYSRTVPKDHWGTICLPWQSTQLEGGTFYEVQGTKDPEQGIALTPIDQLVAGKPYVFKATANQINVTYDPATEVNAEVEGNHIFGSFTECPVPSGMYILYNDLLYITYGSNAIDAYRAYFDVDGMGLYNPASAPARTVFMGGRQSPTDIDTIHTPPFTIHKVLENGRLVIIKNNKRYNTQGIEL